MQKIFKTFVLLILTLVAFSNVLAQGNGLSFAGGIGYSGENFSNSRIGFFANTGIPISSSEIRLEFSYYSFPYDVGSNNLKLASIEGAFHYGGFPEAKTQRYVLFYIGGGVNINSFSGGAELKTKKGVGGFDSTYFGSIGQQIRMGFGINLGVGVFISTLFSIYVEYTAKGIFYSDEGIGWGGLRLGIRYQSID